MKTNSVLFISFLIDTFYIVTHRQRLWFRLRVGAWGSKIINKRSGNLGWTQQFKVKCENRIVNLQHNFITKLSKFVLNLNFKHLRTGQHVWTTTTDLVSIFTNHFNGKKLDCFHLKHFFPYKKQHSFLLWTSWKWLVKIGHRCSPKPGENWVDGKNTMMKDSSGIILQKLREAGRA